MACFRPSARFREAAAALSGTGSGQGQRSGGGRSDGPFGSFSWRTVEAGEGHGRFGRDRQHHWRIAYASAKEAECHLRLLASAGAVDGSGVTKALESFDQVRSMTWRLLNPL